MIINKFGVVIIEKDAIKIEDWQVERESGDPTDATSEQLLLGYATDWALKRLKDELSKAAFDVFRNLRARN
jgi:hypothetical protein